MKIGSKLLALLLALSMLTAMAACTQTEEETQPHDETVSEKQESGSQSADETQTEYMPDIEKKDYGDSLYMQGYAGLLSWMYAEEGRDDVVTEALYARQQRLYEHLGVDLVGTPAVGDNAHYIDAFTTSVKNKDGAIDLFIPHAYASTGQVVQGGYSMDLGKVSMLDLSADYWNEEYMDSLSVFGRYYLGYGDFCIQNAQMVAYNKVLLAQYGDSLSESVYDSVRGYRWTVDKMISVASLVYIDKTGDGKTADDTYGMSGQQWIPFIGFLHASNIQLVEQNEKGDYEVSVFNEKNRERTATLVKKLKEFAASNAAWLKFREEETPIIELPTGRALMTLLNTKSLSNLLNSEVEFGVLPYPMYDEAQKSVGYRHLNYDGYLVIPSYSRNLEMVAESLELLNFWSANVRVAVYEKLLGKQVADLPDDAAMLDIVWDTLVSDFGLTYSYIDTSLNKNLYMLPWLTNPNGTDEVASYVAGYTKAANRAIDKFMKTVDKLK